MRVDIVTVSDDKRVNIIDYVTSKSSCLGSDCRAELLAFRASPADKAVFDGDSSLRHYCVLQSAEQNLISELQMDSSPITEILF